MKLDRTNRPFFKKPLVLLVILALLVIVIFIILEKTRVTNLVQTPGPQAITPQQAAEQKKTDQAKKQDFIEQAAEPTPANPPQDSDAITLTTKREGSSVTILTQLKGFSGGHCELSIINGAKTHTATAEIIYQPEFSSCAGFGVPVDRLGPGLWSITLKATPTGGDALSKSTTFEVK